MTFGERFKQALEHKDFTQKQFAEKMHVNESAISDYVNDRRYPNIQLVKEFAIELDISLDFLLDHAPRSEKVALSSEEYDLINKFRSLSEDNRDLFCKLIEALSQK